MTADKTGSTQVARAATSRRSERGTALIEFALVLPFVLLLTVCVVDIGRAFYTKNILATAVREGARLLAVNDFADVDMIETRVRQVAALSGVAVTSVAVEDIGNQQGQVTANAQFDWLFPGLFQWVGAEITDPMPLSASAVMRVE
jgi:Flp pilus assembly protein TadG